MTSVLNPTIKCVKCCRDMLGCEGLRCVLYMFVRAAICWTDEALKLITLLMQTSYHQRSECKQQTTKHQIIYVQKKA
jgi:hypothetical protein